jgi:Tol biopolymer transport system component
MFCTACASRNPTSARSCDACGVALQAPTSASGRDQRTTSATRLAVVVVWVALLALPIAGVAASAAVGASLVASDREDHRRALSAALLAGELSASRRHAAAVQSDQPTAALAALANQRAMQERATARALALIAQGDWDGAAQAAAPVARAFPGDRDALETLRTARELRIAAWHDDLGISRQQEDWLAVETALAGLAAASPGDGSVARRSGVVRNAEAPVALARDRALWLAQADGTGERLVTDDVPVARPVWSFDRTRIAFVSTDPFDGRAAGTLFVVPATGGNPREVYAAAHPNAVPSWSPDGSAMALTSITGWDLRRETGQLSVRIVDVRTGGSTDVSGSIGMHGMSPAWSPRGDVVAFLGRPLLDDAQSSPLSGPAEVWTWSRGDGAPRLLTAAIPDANRLLWSPDGTVLAVLLRQPGLPGQTGGAAASIALLDPESGDIRSLAEDIAAPSSSWAPAWSPDGQWLAWVDPPGDIVLRAIDGRQRRVSIRRFLAGSLTWSPGGRSLLAPAAEPSEPAARVDDPTNAATVHAVDLRYDTEWPTGAPQWGPAVAAPIPQPVTVDGTGLDRAVSP